MSVHQAMQGLRLSGLSWLDPAQPQHAQQAQQMGGRPDARAAGGAPQDPGPAAATNQPQQPQQVQQGQKAQRCPSMHAAQHRQLALWLGWLFCVLVVPLLRAHFYCSESEAYRQQVFYYRWEGWCAAGGRVGGYGRQWASGLPSAEPMIPVHEH